MKHIKRLLIILVLLTATVPVPLARAEGGLVFNPYWTFETKTPVTHVETGDINGDGVLEVVILTADNWVYVLENDGDLAWRYEKRSASAELLVADLDGDGHTAEIYVFGDGQDVLLSDVERPVWNRIHSYSGSALEALATDLDGDGQPEMPFAYERGVFSIDIAERHYADLAQWLPSVDLWAGDVDGDGRSEIVPSPASGNQVYVFEGDNRQAWQKDIDGEVGLVQGGDVDGDGQAEVVVLGAAWDLFLLESDGRQAWHKQSISVENVPDGPVPGQLMVHDLDGDGQGEIVVLAPAPAAAVHVFDGEGRQVWQHSLDAISSAARLTADDIDGDGGAEVVVTSVGQRQVYLLGNDGQRLAEYRPPLGSGGTTGALDYADLNGDGWGEVIVGTQTGVQVFGTSNHVVPRELWQSGRVQGAVSALYLGDADGDGRAEVVVGSNEGWVYVLADEEHILVETDLGAAVLALSAGDVDDDGWPEYVVATFGGVEAAGGNPVHVLDHLPPPSGWAIPVKASFINSLAVLDLDGDGRGEIIAGGVRGAVGTVVLLEGHGDLIWQREFEEQVTAVYGQPPGTARMGGDGGQVLVGTGSGRVYRLTADGSTVEEYDLGAKVLGFGPGLAATADGRVYDLGDAEPRLVRELGGSPRKVQFDAESTVMFIGEHEVSLVTGDGSIWQGAVDGRAISIAAGDLNGDGEAEMAVGTDQGRVHVFGLALDQPPMLTEPLLAETRTGYAYSVDVNDPEGDAVPIRLEVWDPSAGAWMTQPAQSLDPAQEQGRLVWEVAEPFDMWDSGQESRFRFSYDDGVTQGSLEMPGPLTIPTTAWYVYFGQRVGLGVLILLVPALGWLLYRRQRAYRRSPVGQAEALLRQLQASPSQALLRLHDLARQDPIRLAYMPGLAREAGEQDIADLSDGLHLILTRPEVTAEDLRAMLGASESLNASQGERSAALADLYQLLRRSLEANTVSRIVGLRSRLDSLGRTLDQPDLGLSEAAEALANLGGVAQALRNYQRVDLVEDKTAYLAQAMESLSRLERGFRAKLPQPERNVLSRIAGNWLIVTTNAFQDLQGRAQIEVSLRTRQLLSLEGATLSLELSNTGRSAASNLSVALLPGQGYTLSDGAAYLDILAAGRSALVELPVSVAPRVDQFRAEFAITFDDRERSGKSLAFADVVHLLRPVAEFQPIANPYAPGTPLAPGSPIFFGREDLFQFMAENMAGLARQNILVLIGQRRMGKTSFLRQLPARLGPDYLPVYVDGQSLGVDPGMANFFYDLSLAIVDALDDQGVKVEEPALEDFQEGPSRSFERGFLPVVLETIGGRQLLLLFDEFEELELRVESGKLEATIFSFFRHLMQHVEGLGFIFVGTHRLEALSSDYWSIFFNIALYKHVAFLSDAAAQALIVEPVAKHGLRYDELAVDKMLRVTAGHPYFLQLTCHSLVNHANRERRGYLTIQDVNDVLGEMVELGEAHFAFLWEQSSPEERLVLATLTRLLGQEPTVTAAQVAELLAERGVGMEARDAAEALRHLVERDIVREVRGQPPRYEYKVELVRLWVERSKALGKVMEEVG